jgi:hypothetical protein
MSTFNIEPGGFETLVVEAGLAEAEVNEPDMTKLVEHQVFRLQISEDHVVLGSTL